MGLLRDDRALLDGFRAGDRAALERVYWHYVDAVEHVVRKGVVLSTGSEVRGVPAHAVGDLVQDVFIKAFAQPARLRYDGLRPYKPYLLTIARNLVVDRARKSGREISMDALPEDDAAPAPDTEVEPWADPRTMAVVEAFVAGLEPPLSDIYEYRYQRGASQAEAAKALNIGRQTIRTAEKKLREGLAAALEAEEIGEVAS